MQKSRIAESKLSIEDLKKRFEFDFETGAIFNKKTGNRIDKVHHFKGQSSSNTRYKQVQMHLGGQNVKISAHRMIWAIVHGRWPAEGMDIDHKNSNTQDNRPSNLEEVTEKENILRGLRNRKANTINAVKSLQDLKEKYISEGMPEEEAQKKALIEMTKNPGD